jgi:hypothetical protein
MPYSANTTDEELLGFFHPAFKNRPDVKYVILYPKSIEGYATYADAWNDWQQKPGSGIFTVGEPTVAVAKFKKFVK